MRKILVPCVLLFAACNTPAVSTEKNPVAGGNCSATVEDIQSALLGKSLSSISDFNKCFAVSDTLMSDEEGVEFKGKVFSANGTILFLAEAGNASNPETVSRITIESATMATKNGVKVGDTFKKILPVVSSEIPGLPDGYLGVLDKDNAKTMYQLNSEDFSEDLDLEIGGDIKKIPETMRVTAIVIDGN